MLLHCVSSALCYLDLYWKKTSSCSAFWQPITNSGGARHFCKHGWTMDVVLCSGSFMTSGMPLILWASVSSHQDFQTCLSYFLFEGTGVLKDKGGIQCYYFYPLPAPLFFLLPSFHAAVEHLRKTCLPLSEFPTNANWASGKRKRESWGQSWNQALAWLHIILLLCFKGDLEKKNIYFPQTAWKEMNAGDHDMIMWSFKSRYVFLVFSVVLFESAAQIQTERGRMWGYGEKMTRWCRSELILGGPRAPHAAGWRRPNFSFHLKMLELQPPVHRGVVFLSDTKAASNLLRPWWEIQVQM